MSSALAWVLVIAGFSLLIVLHEAGHFAAAKAVGMRVERFAVFFPPLIARIRRGETEYGIGAIPLGGYVRITGMNPTEEIPPGGSLCAVFSRVSSAMRRATYPARDRVTSTGPAGPGAGSNLNGFRRVRNLP